MDNQVDHSTREIMRMNAEDIPRMQESTFVQTWLLTLHEYLSGGAVSIGLWLDENRISVFSEVEIIDSAGQPLYRVPSIFIKQDKVLPATVSGAIGDIMYRVENLNRTIPGKGNEYIQREITDHVIERNEVGSYHTRWDAIFTKYDLAPVFSSSPGSVMSSNDEDGEFDDYDEL